MTIYLVTGAAGFIGSNIVEELVRRGQTVRAFDDFSTGHKRNVEPFLDSIEFIQGSVGNEALQRPCKA